MLWVEGSLSTCLMQRQGLPCIKRPSLFFKSANLDKSQLGCINRQIVEGRLSTQSTSLVPVGTLVESQCIQVWKNVNSMFLFNYHKDLAFEAVHGCLQTRALLYRRRCFRSSARPRLNCHAEESVVQILWACPFAQRVWGIVHLRQMALYRNPVDNDIYYMVKLTQKKLEKT